MEPITIDELLAELQKLGVKEDDQTGAMTVKELRKHWNKSDNVVRDILKRAAEADILVISKKIERTIDGRDFPIPAYHFKARPKIKVAKSAKAASKTAKKKK